MLTVVVLKYVVEKDIGQIIEQQFEKGEDYIWNTKGSYSETVQELFKEDSSGALNVIVAGYSSELNLIEKIWIGKCRKYRSGPKIILENAYLLDSEYSEKISKLYFRENNEDLKDTPKYLFSTKLSKSEFFFIINNFNLLGNQREIKVGPYTELTKNQISSYTAETEQGLHQLAQRNVYAKRVFGFRKPHQTRTEFQRDFERIVHCKAFRRLVDKAQIYTSSKGDHFRTRLTHTLEVCQIARGIARSLRLNEDLTEAIALGHDLGHTPFGHEGERELDLIMAGKAILSDGHQHENFGGFKHNYQGLRIANYLEEKYCEHEGLDLTTQTLEGILKHTKIKKCKSNERHCGTCHNKCFDIDEFFPHYKKDRLHLSYDFPTTLEGQIVQWADEIAQRSHDLDDGISSGVLSIDTLLKDLIAEKDMAPIVEVIVEVNQQFDSDEARDYVDRNDLKRASLVSKVIRFFMGRLISSSRQQMDNYLLALQCQGVNFDDISELVITQQVIKLQEDAKVMLDKLEDMITLKVINSQEVNCFDGKSAYIIRKLFKAYYCNPRQLPDSVLRRIDREVKKFTKNWSNIRIGNKDKVKEEIEIYKGITGSNSAEDYLKRRVFMRCIADFISGMTDDFAKQQFNELYIPK